MIVTSKGRLIFGGVATVIISVFITLLFVQVAVLRPILNHEHLESVKPCSETKEAAIETGSKQTNSKASASSFNKDKLVAAVTKSGNIEQNLTQMKGEQSEDTDGFKNLMIFNASNVKSTHSITLLSHHTVQIRYPGFTLTLVMSSIHANGDVEVNVGYFLPGQEEPESERLQIATATAKVVESKDSKQKLFFIRLIAVEALEQKALVEVGLLKPLRDLTNTK